MAVAVLGLAAAGLSPAATASAEVPRVAPGACGSVLLAGSNWLGGRGVDVRSNGADQSTGTSCGGKADNTVNGVPTGLKWQCIELVNRLFLTRGWISKTWRGNGGRSSPSARDSMYDYAPAALPKKPNGSISSLGPGDVVSINVYDHGAFQADGHVLVVNSAGPVTSGTVPLISQNGGDSRDAEAATKATLSDGTLTIASSGHWSYSVIGVVYAPGWTATRAPVPANANPSPYEGADGLGSITSRD
jgi:hypothetical protein